MNEGFQLQKKGLNTIVTYMFDMDTTIQVSSELRDALAKRKIDSKESYESVIWDLLEDSMELSEETKKDIEIALKEAKEGKVISHSQLKKELGL